MPRFYVSQPLVVGAVIDLPDTVAHHVHVLRLQVGDALSLFNGDGGEYVAALATVDRKRASAVVQAYVAREVELPFEITLAQALPEAAKMDWIVEKAVELGVATIVPLAAQRCVVRLNAERAEKKLAHWRGVIASASEQCGRNRLARVHPLADFGAWIAEHTAQPRIIFTPRASASLADWARARPPQTVCLMIGPEGGFSEQEEAQALAHGALALSLGPRVLRTETAGLAAAAALGALWGGF